MIDPVEHEIERLTAVIVPYLCERTGLSAKQVRAVLDAQEMFWDNQPSVVGRMFILGFPIDDDPEPV